MGTNYYLNTDCCPCCGKPRKQVHLGKSSIGWKFLFYKQGRVHDYKSFCEFIKRGEIVDEYGDVVDKEYLLDLIDAKQSDRNHDDVENIEGYNFSKNDFF